MNGTVPESLKIVTGLEHHIKTPPDVDLAVAPPFTALYSVSVALQESSILLAAQNCHWEEKGALTGEVSPAFLADLGCRYVIVGHSERRHLFGETDEMINRKVHSTLRNDLLPIFCVGETEQERERGTAWQILDAQVKRGLAGLHMKELDHLVVAYEPVWAIGTGKTASAAQISEVHAFIRNLLEKLFDAPSASTVKILYGGSVKAENAAGLAAEKSIDGCLVGGASLEPAEFAAIVRAMERRPSES